jgi:hypothetical protein
MILLEIFMVFVDSEGKLFLRDSCTFTWIIIENNPQLKTVFLLSHFLESCMLFIYVSILFILKFMKVQLSSFKVIEVCTIIG